VNVISTVLKLDYITYPFKGRQQAAKVRNCETAQVQGIQPQNPIF